MLLPLTDDFYSVTRNDLTKIASEIDNRPHQTLNWIKPSDVFPQIVAPTG
jgi:IS30 family transposase